MLHFFFRFMVCFWARFFSAAAQKGAITPMRRQSDGMRIALVVALVVFWRLPSAFASESLDSTAFLFSSDRKEYALNKALDIFEDTTASRSFDEVRSGACDALFRRYAGASDPNFGHTASVFWVRITLRLSPQTIERLQSARADWYLEIAYPQLDDIRFFAPVGAEYVETLSGDMRPFAMRDVFYRMPSFRVRALTKPETLECDSAGFATLRLYFRLQSEGSMTFPMILRSADAMSAHIANEQLVLGMFYGALAVMIGYNLFIFFSLGDVSYLYYVSYILTYGFFLFIWNGFAFQYLWSESPLWHNRSIIVFMGLSGLSVFRFSQNYLDTEHITPRAHRFMNLVMLYFIVGIALAFVLPYGIAIRIMYGAPIITLPIIVTVSVICLRNGYRPARYFLVAWILLLISITMAALRNINVLPSGPLTIYGLQIGSASEILLLSLGLADRINVIKQEKKIAQDEALRNQQLLIEALRRSEQELERNVQERTRELQDANEEISRQLEIQAEQSREIELANTTLQEKNLIIEQERERSEALLLNILPSSVAARLMAGEKLIADRFQNVAIIFADIANFTRLSSAIAPEELVGLLDTVFSEFDAISERYGLEKIKTIGDCYMAVCGLPEPTDRPAERAAEAALAMTEAVRNFDAVFAMNLQIRIGLHYGNVIAGVIGKKKFAYDLWGDAVNIASRMESQGESGKIQCSDEAYYALRSSFAFEERGMVEMKGIGQRKTWYLLRPLREE